MKIFAVKQDLGDYGHKQGKGALSIPSISELFMSNIKKQFAGLHSFLVANQEKKIKTVLSELVEQFFSTVRATNGSTVLRNEAGEVLAGKCSYFGAWFPVEAFHPKAGTPTGINSLCKLAAARYAKAKRDADKANADLLQKVATGELPYTEIPAELKRIEEMRSSVGAIVNDDGTVPQHWATKEEAAYFYGIEAGEAEAEAESE